MDDWTLCWEINLKCHVRAAKNIDCLLCDGSQPKGSFHSTFVRDVTSCGRKHSWATWAMIGSENGSGICGVCDEELVWNITKRKQKCLSEGCESILNVDEKALEKLIDDKELLAKYLNLLDQHRVYTCVIHQDEEPLEDSARSATVKCKHDPNACRDCLAAFLADAINNGRWQEIICPDPTCKEELGAADVQAFASREVFQKYEELVTMQRLSRLPNFRWCAGSSSKCGSGLILSPKTETWTCKRCSTPNCFSCKTIYHVGKTCQQYQRFRGVDSESFATLMKTTKACPKRDCTKRIEKHLKCKDTFCEKRGGGCGTEFCWNCKIIYKSGERGHLAECRYAGTKTTVPKPSPSDPLYADGWDEDPDYVPPDDEYLWT